MKKLKKTYFKKGFTFVEIIITILVVSTIAALVLPRYQMVLEKTKSAEGTQILLAIADAKERFRQENGQRTTNLNDLDVTIPTSKDFQQVELGNPLATDPSYEAKIKRKNDQYALYVNSSGTFFCENIVESLNGPCKKMGYTVSIAALEEPDPIDEEDLPPLTTLSPVTTQPPITTTSSPITAPPCKKFCIEPGDIGAL